MWGQWHQTARNQTSLFRIIVPEEVMIAILLYFTFASKFRYKESMGDFSHGIFFCYLQDNTCVHPLQYKIFKLFLSSCVRQLPRFGSKTCARSVLSVFGILCPHWVRHDNLPGVHGSLMEGTSTNLTLNLVNFIPLLPGKVPSSLESPSPQAGVLSRGASQGWMLQPQLEQSRSWWLDEREWL